MKLTQQQAVALQAVLADEPADKGKHVWITAVGKANGWFAALRITIDGKVHVHQMRQGYGNRDAAIKHAQWARKQLLTTRTLP